MLKLKVVICFVIFTMLLLTVGCRQRIINNSLPTEEPALSYGELTTEPPSVPEVTETTAIPELTTEPETVAETTEMYEEPTTMPTIVPETTKDYEKPTQTEPATIPAETTTEPPPTAQKLLRNESVSPEPVSYTEAALNIEVVKEADDIFQIPDENNVNQEENVGNQNETNEEQEEQEEQGEIQPEAVDTDTSENENIVTLEELPEESGQTAISDNGTGTIGIIVDRYAEFLNTSLITLYDCQKYYIYYEGINEYQTINRFSAEHKLIVDASGYNVGEKLKDDALTVSGDWVLRKNPSMIIKCVGGDILGGNITDASYAKSVSEDIISRSEWDGIGAVINRNIILISEELLSSEDGKLLIKLYIASAMYPELFNGVEISDFCLQIKDAGGNDYTNGTYFYSILDSNG